MSPLALTCGEPAGVSPEIAFGAWAELRSDPRSTFLLIGDGAYFSQRNGGKLPIREIQHPSEAAGLFAHALPVLNRPLPKPPKPGHIENANSKTVIEAIDEAVSLAFAGEVSGIVTNPIQKEALYAAGFKHQGHTDYLAHLAKAHGHDVTEVMMLAAKDLRTIPVTVHIPLAEVPSALTAKADHRSGAGCCLSLSNAISVSQGHALPSPASIPMRARTVPWAREDRDIIAPAIKQLASEGLDVERSSSRRHGFP